MRLCFCFFLCKQKPAYEWRISDWSSDVCSSDLGGQTHDGTLTVPQIAQQVAAEGAKKIVVVSDEPQKYPSGIDWPRGTTFHHRDDLKIGRASRRERVCQYV